MEMKKSAILTIIVFIAILLTPFLVDLISEFPFSRNLNVRAETVGYPSPYPPAPDISLPIILVGETVENIFSVPEGNEITPIAENVLITR